MRYATTAARNVVSFSALIGPFEFERECERPLNLSARSNSNGPIRVGNETTLRAAVVAYLITRVSGHLASDVRSGLPFHSFRRRSNGFK